MVNEMANDSTGTPTPEDQNPTDGPDAQAPASAAQAPEPPKDEAAVLQSRLRGQDAKISTLTTAQKAAEDRAAAAEAKLAQYEQGKLGTDDALRAQLETAQKQTEEALKEAKAARLEAKFPETFAVFGVDAALFSEDKLAASEARLQGEASDGNPTPRGNNPTRTGTRSTPAAPTIQSIEAEIARIGVPGFNRS